MLNKFVRIFGGDPNKREIEKFNPVVDQINSLEPQFEGLSDEQLRDKTVEFRGRLSSGEDLNDILPEAFAAVREASKRTLGLRHYDVQLVGGVVLHQGKIAEMRTGEGKTLVATLPLYLNALTRRGVHLITVNDYLARRDARWMGPVFAALGLRVGVLQMAARTENGKKAFLVNLERRSPHEDQDQLDMVPRREAYLADITYGTNSEFGFDYLRDNMTMSLEERVQRGHYYAIVDEVDNVLIDEARTPLIISGPAHDDTEWYVRMAQVIRQLRPEDYEISERDRTVTLTEIGESHVEEVLGIPLRDPDRPEDVTPEQARLLGYLEQALRAQFLFKRNKDYLVQGGKVTIIDEFTGRLMPGRRWSDGLHQAVEAKEGARVQSENVTYATITIQNYFRMYEKLAGMTGTALTEAEEFSKIYKLDVLAIPTNLEFQASQVDSSIIESEGRDEAGYKYHFYTHREDPENIPVFWKRKDYPDVIFRTEEAKFRAITQEILRYHVMGRPLLVGTTSVELSERLSTRLRAEPLRRLAQVILIREAWLEKNNREEDGRMIPELQPLNQPLEQLQVPDLRKMARELDVSFSPEDTANLERLQLILNLGEEDRPRLMASLQAGIPHQVLNARKHTEESQIIAGAGAFGGVMIATNMAGRGVDIKLGGELAEEVLVAINRVLEKAGYDDPYNMTPEDRRQALQALDPGQYGIYESEVLYFLEFMENSKRVKELGGLHVIGSERHEARRIDNQLRGRAARQGDPGSSRFYLSLEDELMRRFGGQQANDMMQRLKVDDAMPIEVGLVGRIVEQSQTRVEGANFDVRKHLLEYDDVLNTQRASIYTQRNRIFTKQDLSEDVTEMLRTEVMRRVPEALKDPEGPWKLLAWLDQIQPTLSFGGNLFPSYSQSLLLKQVLGDGHSQLDRQAAIRRLQDIAGESLKAEGEHLLRSVYNLLDLTEERLKATQAERMETLETYFEGLDLEGDEETGPRQPREIVDELSALLHMSLRLNPEQLRALRDDPDLVQEDLRVQVQAALYNQAITRLVGALERRLEEPLGLNPSQLSGEEWEIISDQVLDAVQAVLDSRFERLLGDDSADSHGQIGKDLESAIERADGSLNEGHLLGLLTLMPQGSRAFFDRKTHRKMMQRTTRLTYVYHAAKLLENKPPEEIAGDVLAHLEEAQANIRRAWGASEWGRISAHSPAELDKTTQQGLRKLWGEEIYVQLEVQPLANLSADQAVPLVDELGRQALTEVYRQLLLGVITELWVDYLTQMEALRVAIGLEAYAQRDPLVQYKNKAFALFQDLLGNMRLGVVTRMFTFQPRDMSRVQAAVTRAEASRPEAQAMEAAGNGSDQDTLPDEASRRSMAETTPTTPVKVTQQAPGKPAPSGKSKRRRRRR